MADPALPGIVFFGTPDFAVPSLRALVDHRLNVSAVVTAPDKPAGRGLKIRFPAVKSFALDHGIPVLQPLSLKDPAFLEELGAYGHVMQVVVAFRKLPSEVWQLPGLGTFNLHASLLPDYRGAAPVNWVLINGETETGLTTFLINDTIDTGSILLQVPVPLPSDMNAGELHDVLMHKGAQLVLETARGILENRLRPVPQPGHLPGGRPLHTAPKLTREHCRIDWSAPARAVSQLVRGLSPYPGAFSTLKTGTSPPLIVKILASTPLPGEISPGPGSFLSDSRSFLHIGCGDGVLAVTRLQAEGRKSLNINDFLRGWPGGAQGRFV